MSGEYVPLSSLMRAVRERGAVRNLAYVKYGATQKNLTYHRHHMINKQQEGAF